jgi:mono/diheme cytochrome c family protein
VVRLQSNRERFEICRALLSIAKEATEMPKTFDGLLRMLVLVACSTFVAIGGSVSFAADAYQGKDIAQRWCAGCHVVERDQKGPAIDQAPPFASVGRTPGFDDNKLAILLLKPHPNMPKLALSREEVANLTAYILTLK